MKLIIVFKSWLLLGFCFVSVLTVKGQVNHDAIRLQVFQKAMIGKTFTFGKWTKNGQTETRLQYLGTFIGGQKTYKVMNSAWFWGLTRRATSRILIYDNQNRYIGNYYLTLATDLPDKLADGKLIFTNKGKPECDKALITKVDMNAGIPKSFFLKCKGNEGDIYSFSTE